MRCNLCKSENTKLLFYSKNYPDGRIGNVVRCKRCGLIYRDCHQKPDFSSDQKNQTKFRPDYPSNITNNRLKILNNYANHVALYRKHNRILDVGSGHGFFLKLCFEKSWQVWGAEVDPELVRFSMEELGIGVLNGSFEELEFSNNFFDVVTFINVLEHLQDPDIALKKAYRILRPGGAIFLRFPNAAIHIPLRFVFYNLYRYWKGIKRFDVSNINSYAFDSLSIFRYLEKADFKDQITKYDRPSSLSINIKERSFEKVVIKYLVISLADIIKIITKGKHLIAPSLSVKAVKPL